MPEFWQSRGWRNQLLRPLSWGFCLVSLMRRLWLQYRQKPSPVPVIVVGNISVGGNGKTPVVINLAKRLHQAGVKVAVVSRGYGGRLRSSVERCYPSSDPGVFGDEPVLIAKHSQVPVIVGSDRVCAVSQAAALGCQLVVSDDGLQHYAMARALEIAVVSHKHNGYLLPAGPLRESEKRLQSVDVVLGDPQIAPVDFSITTHYRGMFRVSDDEPVELAALADEKLVAVSGIANPQRFHQLLSAQGLAFKSSVFADHHDFQPEDFPDQGWVIMTEKDAVKCRSFANPRMVYAAIEVSFSDQVIQRCLAVLSP